MKISKIQELLDAKMWVGQGKEDTEVSIACGSDLMSDVLAFVKEKVVLLTGLVNPQVIRTAEMMDIKAIVFVRGKQPTEDIIELAKMKDIIVLTTPHPMYIACGILYVNGLTYKDEKDEA
ncbi:MAG: hypothetical protein GX366_01245 [Epulopiscium sp.]|nr:hypothetical protein [Candidatus Epulonipiscium sp.]